MHRTLFSLALAFSIPACSGDDEGTDDHTGTHDEAQAVALALDAMVGAEPAACGSSYVFDGVDAQLADARMYLSQVEVLVDGSWAALELDETDWQYQGVALLDWEDGTGACADSGTADLNDTLTGTAPAGTIEAVRFEVGVPFELNHNDTATAPAPLNAPGMFWTWQGGYKFVRVDYMVDGGERWNVHVGSTGCLSDAPVEAPTEECAAPNRATVELPVVDGQAIVVDLAALVAGADIATNTAKTPPGCMSSPTEPVDCTPVWDNLGLDFASGTCVGDCAGQAVFQ